MTLPQKYSLFGLLSLALFSPASAQTQSSTPVIGYYKQNLAEGGNLITAGFVTKADFQGQATAQPTIAATTMTVTQTGAAWSTNQFNTATGGASSHYLEILSDGNAAHAGLILDIISNGATTLDVEVPVGFTLPGGNPPFSYVIRAHATLSTIFPVGGGLQPFEDLVSTFDEFGNESIFWINGNNDWENINTNQISNTKVIYPCQGMVVSTGGVRTVTIGGGTLSYVKSTPTRVSVFTAPLGVPNLVGLINPLVGVTAGDTSNISALGLSSLADYEDSIAVLSSDGSLNVSSLYSVVGGNIVDENFAPIPVNTTIPNGGAVVISLGSNSNSILTQGAPASP